MKRGSRDERQMGYGVVYTGDTTALVYNEIRMKCQCTMIESKIKPVTSKGSNRSHSTLKK